MYFRVFGIPTRVTLSFWLTGLFLGFDTLRGDYPANNLVWIAVVFFSIMVHELGHAFAMMRYGLQPEITLHFLGGLTSGPGMQRLGRLQRIFVSFAGPLAGFVLGGMVYGLTTYVPDVVPQGADAASAAIRFFITMMMYVNIVWGLVNLLPVLPFDGGHILEDALGPKRQRAALIVSMGVGGLITLWAIPNQAYFIAILFGLAAFQSYQRYRLLGTPQRPQAPPVRQPEIPVPPEIAVQLDKAEAALGDDRYEEAATGAQIVLTQKTPRGVRLKALHILAWAALLQERIDEAERATAQIRRETEPDPALAGAILLHKGAEAEARAIFEAARARGDDRKEVVGPLIQLLIKQGEVARAAATAFDIVDSLSSEDARQMADIAAEAQAFNWAARLYESVFDRDGAPDDGYAAVRMRALDGDVPGALALLKRAVEAGFSDAARAWSDNALENLRAMEPAELEALLPPAEGN